MSTKKAFRARSFVSIFVAPEGLSQSYLAVFGSAWRRARTSASHALSSWCYSDFLDLMPSRQGTSETIMVKFVFGLTAGLVAGISLATSFSHELGQIGEWLAWASLVTLL